MVRAYFWAAYGVSCITWFVFRSSLFVIFSTRFLFSPCCSILPICSKIGSSPEITIMSLFYRLFFFPAFSVLCLQSCDFSPKWRTVKQTSERFFSFHGNRAAIRILALKTVSALDQNTTIYFFCCTCPPTETFRSRHCKPGAFTCAPCTDYLAYIKSHFAHFIRITKRITYYL